MFLLAPSLKGDVLREFCFSRAWQSKRSGGLQADYAHRPEPIDISLVTTATNLK
jgi:hypothetical protein